MACIVFAMGQGLGALKNICPCSITIVITLCVQNAVCFDVDCTITVNDTLDLLAEFMGVGEAVAALTNKVGTSPPCKPIILQQSTTWQSRVSC